MSLRDDELEFHLEMLTRRFLDEGHAPDEARRRSEARIGDITAALQERRDIQKREETHVQRKQFVQSLIQDVRYAVRTLRRSPAFTIAALVTLAVGIGATTAIFSVVHAVLLQDLPYPNAERTLYVFNSYEQEGLSEAAMSPEEFADLKSQSQAFEHLVALRPQVSALTDDCSTTDCEPLRVNAVVLSSRTFEVLGLQPALGRNFVPADGRVDAERVVLLSDTLWRSRYGADERVVGRTISLGGLPRTVVGVMPPDVRLPDEPLGYLREKADIWIPLDWEQRQDGRGNQYLEVLGVMRQGVTVGQAQADLQRIGENYKARFPSRYAEPEVRWALRAKPLRDELVGDVRNSLMILFAAAGCVLLIACANVANLLLARGVTRARELAVRSALGAARRRIIQQLLVETMVLALSGAVLGVFIAALSLQVLVAVHPADLPRLDQVQLDVMTLLFAVVAALVTSVVIGLAPAVSQSPANPQSALGTGGRGSAGVALRRTPRAAMVVLEVALAGLVLTAAALLVRSYDQIVSTPLGLNTNNVAVTRLTLARAEYDQPVKVFDFHRGMRDRLQAVPGVETASAMYPLPLSGSGWSGTVGVVSRPRTPGLPEPHAEFAVALPGYFRTLGIPLLEGRDFSESDTADVQAVAIVDAEFARQYFPGRSPIGERLAWNGNLDEGPFQTIVGVVGHVRSGGPRRDGEGQVYFAALQKQEFSLFFVTRTATTPSSVMPAIRSAVRDVNQRLPIAQLTTMSELERGVTSRERFNAGLFLAFGIVALAIAATGLYGVLAFVVAQRTRDIGVRLALGGKPSTLVRGVVAESLLLSVAGLAIGFAGAWLLGNVMDELLFGVDPVDPISYGVIVVTMLGVAAAAAWGPARRVARVDPATVLRG